MATGLARAMVISKVKAMEILKGLRMERVMEILMAIWRPMVIAMERAKVKWRARAMVKVMDLRMETMMG